MLYAHILEAIADGQTKYVLVFRDFYEFYSSQERAELTHCIRWTFKEPSGARGSLNAQIAAWAKDNNISIVGIPETSKYFKPDIETYIKQLESRIEQMATLLQERTDAIDDNNVVEEQEEANECPAHEKLEKLQDVVRLAQQSGCRHIDDAIKEMDQGGKNGH
ncbi:MAG: hypothetical protein AAB795_02370 [Patescibacteria group bacterium]